MRKLRVFLRPRILLLALPVLALLVVGVGSPGRAEGQPAIFPAFAWWYGQGAPVPGTGGETGDEFTCWASGPLAGGTGWGDDDLTWGQPDEFVLDPRDLGSSARFPNQVVADRLESPHNDLSGIPHGHPIHHVYALFDSLPEFVEYAFALDTVRGGSSPDRQIEDRRVKRLSNFLITDSVSYYPKTGYPLAPKEETRPLLPKEWSSTAPGANNLEKYRSRRAIAIPYDDAVVSYEVGWHDPTAPGGGSTNDAVAMAQDEVSNWIENMESTTTHAGGGGIIHFGTTEGVGQQVLFQADENCGNTGVCNGLVNFSSNPVPLTLHTNIREQNDGQFDENVVGPGERVQVAVDGRDPVTGAWRTREVTSAFDQRRAPPSGTSLMNPWSGAGYVRQFQPDTAADVLRVNLELRSEHRRDLAKFDPGPGFDPNSLSAMGRDPWTYDLISGAVRRDLSVNEWSHVPSHERDDLRHAGYRQPTLSRPYDPVGSGVNDDALTRVSAGHIKWPVNFEDLNWYLYRLPSTGYRDPLWLYWITPRGTSWLVNSAYGQTPVPFPVDGEVPDDVGQDGLAALLHPKVPDCVLPADDAQFAAAQHRAPLDVSAVHCEHEPASPDFDAISKGNEQWVHLPFDYEGVDDWFNAPAPVGKDLFMTLGPDLLVKQGVESAEDVESPLGSRRLSRFSFSILEGQPMGDTPPAQRGYEAERRYGIPVHPEARETYLDGWADEPVNPNMPHLLVMTFYEARFDGEIKFSYYGTNEYGDPNKHVSAFDLPKRDIRRVVCRMMVYPSGFDPPTGEMRSAFDVADDLIGQYVNDWMEQLKAIIEDLLASVSESPLHLGAKTAELACIGMAKVDDLTSLGDVAGPAPPALVDREGRVRVNAAQASRDEGSARCHRISSPPVLTCERSSDFIFEGRCTRLPEFHLSVRAAEFLKPPSTGIEFREYRRLPDHEAYYTDHGEQDFVRVEAVVDPRFGLPTFTEVADLTADPPPDLTAYNRGLTRVALDWDFRWNDSVDPDIYSEVSGFTVYVIPDQKSVSFEVPQTGLGFDLPKWVIGNVTENAGELPKKQEFQVEGFTVGGLDHYVSGSGVIANPHSVSLVSLELPYYGVGYDPVGGRDVTSGFNAFNTLVANMPLAPGFQHGFRVAPYYGVPDTPNFRRGPISETIWLNGDEIACSEIGKDPAAHSAADIELVRELYNCGPGAQVAALGYAPDEWRPGLLSLTGTDICDDIFSSTPAGFTWDNPVVRQVWLLMSVIAGSVLFTLFAWQGLRMTVDIWLDPQPATGFRELMPRFLLSAALVASSLIICQLVLIVASDLTCFVAQFTGMSMWGAIGVTFGSIVDGYMAWYEDLLDISDHTLLWLLSNFLLALVFGLVVVLAMVYILYLFARVFFGMLIRIALLAVLIAFAPIAFAFYASDATSHWTRKWISMFLGATFQQVVILVVIYIGVSMIGNYLSQGTEGDLTNLVIGMIIAFLTLSVAASVPDLVNPGANKMFSSFGQLGGMAGAATLMIASGGAAAVAGGVRGAMGGGGPAGGGSTPGGSAPSPPGPQAPGSGGVTLGGGPGPGGGPGGPGPGPVPSGGNIMSSVSRQHLGPSTGIPSPGGGPVSGGGVPTAPGGMPPSATPGGYTLSTGASPGVSPGSGPPGPGAGSGQQQSQPGFLRRVGSGMATGWRGGTRWGAGMNVRASNLASGRTFYQFSSKGDDAAQQVAKLREDMGEDRQAQRDFYAQLAQALQQGP